MTTVVVIASLALLIFLEFRKRKYLEKIKEESEKMEENIRKLVEKLEDELNS